MNASDSCHTKDINVCYYERRTINVNALFGINIKLIFTKNESVIGTSIRKTDGINIKLTFTKNENLL